MVLAKKLTNNIDGSSHEFDCDLLGSVDGKMRPYMLEIFTED